MAAAGGLLVSEGTSLLGRWISQWARCCVLLAALSWGALAASAQSAAPGPITPAGQRLTALLNGMNVESLWIRGSHVDWRTGVAEGPPLTTPGAHTHCSAFAASVAERLGVYILRPPEHPQDWLANAQERWLNSPEAAGWHRIGQLSDPGASLTAVSLANQGKLVIAIYFQPPRETPDGPKERSGHIAIVRPSQKPAALIDSEGPDVIQAGGTNYRLVALRQGFASHKLGLETGAIEYFWHDANPP
jgi:hypothetical protein